MDNDEKYQRAKKRVEELKGFYIHFLMYISGISFLAIINFVTGSDYLWFFWPAFGWGIGLFFHGLGVFAFEGLFSKDWEERKIKKIMNNMDDN